MMPDAAPVSGTAVRVLLVDPSLTFLDALSRSMQRLPGVSIVGRAMSSLEAVDQALILHPDLILMDIGIGPITGLDATREIKRDSRAPFIALIAAADTAEQVAAARAAGADTLIARARLEDALAGLMETVARRAGKRPQA